MITWLNLFEKYRIDRRVLELYRDELASLSQDSRRRAPLKEAIVRVEKNVHAAERILAHYGDGILSPREALRFADERLFLAYRYVYGLTMEATALEMGISRDTVYRIRRRIVARGAVPPEVLSRFGIVDLSAAGSCVPPCEPIEEPTDRIAPPADRVLLPRPAVLSHGTDDVADVLAACFAGAPRGVPGALLNRTPG